MEVLIRSKSGVASKAAGSGMMLMGLVVAIFCVSGLSQGFQPIWTPLLLGVLGLFMMALGFDEGFLSVVEVTPTLVRLKRWGRWEEYSLEQIDVVDMQRDWLGLGGLILILASKDRSGFQVHLRQYQNRTQLAQQILQVVWSNNPQVILLPRVQRRFGKPPFGKKKPPR